MAFNSSIISWYTTYLSCATFAGSAQSMLNNKAMLAAVEKFKNQPSHSDKPYDGTNHFFAKEVPGLLGAWLCAGYIGRTVDKRPFPMMWKAILLQQACSMGETYTPFLTNPQLFLPWTSACCVGKNISWAATGAIQAKCIQALSKSPSELGFMHSNILKWVTLSSALGMSVGLGLDPLPFVNEQQQANQQHVHRFIVGSILGIMQMVCYRKATRLIYPTN